MTQRAIALKLKLALPTVNHLIGEICEAYLAEARKGGTLAEILIQLNHDRNTIIKAAWSQYMKADQAGEYGPAVAALRAIDGANSNYVNSLCRLGIIEEAPQKVEHSGGMAVFVRTPIPERKALK